MILLFTTVGSASIAIFQGRLNQQKLPRDKLYRKQAEGGGKCRCEVFVITMDYGYGQNKNCKLYESTKSSKWRTWDRDFAEAEEVNTLNELSNELLNVGIGNGPNKSDSTSKYIFKGRGRIKICLAECTLPSIEQLSKHLGLPISSQASTGKFCKLIGKGRGRGRRPEGKVMLGRGIQKDELKKAPNEIGIGDGNMELKMKNWPNLVESMGSTKSEIISDKSPQNNKNEIKEDCNMEIDERLLTLKDDLTLSYLETLEEPDKWIIIDGVPSSYEARKELVNTVIEFGKIQSLSFHPTDKALIRLAEELQCEWIISCLHDTQLSTEHQHKIFVLRLNDVISGETQLTTD